MWPVKLIFIGIFIFILISLFQALNIMRKHGSAVSMSTFIGRRLMVSIVLIICILLAIAFGVITPNARPY